MNNVQSLVLKQSDFQRISTLINSNNSEITHMLEDELNRAQIVKDHQLAPEVVAMNSRVKFRNLETGKELSITLTYPEESNVEENCISVLSPVGAALIGLRVGQRIEWPFPNAKQCTLEVLSVAQPVNIS